MIGARRLLLRAVCRLAGCEWSWAQAVALGVSTGPVCTRCGKTGR